MLEKYGHGGDLLTAAELYGEAGGTFLDYSANINPLGPPPQVLELLRTALSTVVAYPDPGHRRFKRLLAENLGVDNSWLTVGNGAAESMALLLLAIAPQRLASWSLVSLSIGSFPYNLALKYYRFRGQGNSIFALEWRRLPGCWNRWNCYFSDSRIIPMAFSMLWRNCAC